MSRRWHALVLAAGRGPDDPMAKAYGVRHKAVVPVGGQPMLARVVATLLDHPAVASVTVSIDEEAPALVALGRLAKKVVILHSSDTAASSVRDALRMGAVTYPVLLTTADHPLLTGKMIDHFISKSESIEADLTAGLAEARTILSAFPDAKRTFLAFGRDRVSGCNLFGLHNDRALRAIDAWRYLERVRKQPWRLVYAFGPLALLRYASGLFNLESAFAIASRRLGLKAKPILMPFAEAAVDVDKPEDKELAERVLGARPHQS
jgi:GTP:adenosylcobinamide-phosphate guanylyltransferase